MSINKTTIFYVCYVNFQQNKSRNSLYLNLETNNSDNNYQACKSKNYSIIMYQFILILLHNFVFLP